MDTSHRRQVILAKEDHQTAVGDLPFIADQIALEENLRLAGPGDIEAQAKQAWKNIRVVAEKAWAKMTDIVRIRTSRSN